MEVVQQFNAELSSLYEVRPPISKAKMSQITRVSMKAVKMYKHIVQSVERFIVKCRPEYKIPGLYVIDSIVRQSRHQFGIDKDVYASRFSRNFASTFQNLFLTCPPDDKPKIVRVLNLWQRNNVFSAETIQPLLDMANPNASLAQMKFESSSPPNVNTRDTNRDNRDNNSSAKDTNLMIQLQQLANSLGLKSGNSASSNFTLTDSQQIEAQNTIKFNKKLLDFDYGDDEDDEERGETPTEAEPPLRSGALVDDNNVTNPLALSMAQNLLSNPELLQQLQQMHKTIQQTELLKLSISELESHGVVNELNQTVLNQSTLSGQQFLSALQAQQTAQSLIINESSDEPKQSQNKRNEIINAYENMDSKLNIDNNNIALNENNFQYLQNANFAAQSRVNELNFAPNNSSLDAQQYHQQQQQYHQQYHQEMNERSGSQSPRSRSPRRSRFNRYRERSRSRSPRNRRDRERDSRRSYRSRSRSPRNSRFDSSRNNDRSRSPASYERERERERRRRGLPPIRKGYMTICSTTLWLGHVPKLASEADLSDSFGEFGTITSIDLIPPRGCAYVCMNRRQDAAKALSVMRNMKLHGSVIKMAWAPGKGMKGKEFKDYWEADNGASYIPYNRLLDDVDLDLLEEGGTIDEETIPEKLQELRKIKNKEREEKEREAAAAMMARAQLIPMPLVSIPNVTVTPTGLVMQPNMLITQTGQTPVMSVASTSEPSVSVTSSTSFPILQTNVVTSLPSNSNDSITNHLIELNEFQQNMENNQIQLNESKLSEPRLSSPSGPLLPPPLPQFQPPPLGMPPPAIIGGQPPSSLPWLSAPPPPLLHANRLPVSVSSMRAPLIPSVSMTSTTIASPTITTNSSSFRHEDIRQDNIRPMAKPDERPPLIATLPLSIPHSGDELPPRLHQDRNFSGRDRFRGNNEMDRHHPNDDPFAPSVYELRAMERNSIMRQPIPQPMHSGPGGLRPPMPPNMNERFPFDNRPPQRQFHPRQHQNIRHNMHHNYDRHGNPRNMNRGGGRDHYQGGSGGGSRGNFNRRDRPSRWKNDDRDRHFNRNSDFSYNKPRCPPPPPQSDYNNDSNNSANNSNNINDDTSFGEPGEQNSSPSNSEFKNDVNSNSNEQFETPVNESIELSANT